MKAGLIKLKSSISLTRGTNVGNNKLIIVPKQKVNYFIVLKLWIPKNGHLTLIDAKQYLIS